MADVELEDDPTVGGVTLRWLRQLVMSVVSQYPEPDLWDVARKVHAEIPPDLQYQATVILLRGFVQQTIGYDRYRPGSVPREKPDLPAKPRLAPLKGSMLGRPGSSTTCPPCWASPRSGWGKRPSMIIWR
jgi:hypothetical protein